MDTKRVQSDPAGTRAGSPDVGTVTITGDQAVKMIQGGLVLLDSLRVSDQGLATFKGTDGKLYQAQLTKEQRGALPQPAPLPGDQVAISPQATRKGYATDSKGAPRTPLFPEMDNFASAPDRTTLTVGAEARGTASQSFQSILDDSKQPDFPSKDYQGDAQGRAGIKVDSRYLGVAVEGKADGFIDTQGVEQGRKLADEAQKLNAEYNRRMAQGDMAGAWGLLPQATDLMNRAKAYELKLKGQGQLTVDTQIVGRLPLPNFGPLKDLMVSGKLNLHYIPEHATDPSRNDFPQFGHLMGRIEYAGDMHDLNSFDVLEGNAFWNSRLKATMPTSSFGAGFGLGIGSKITDYFRWGFSVDNIAGYIPGKEETWEKRDNLANGQPDGQSGYTKTSAKSTNVYRTFMPPTYRLSMAGVIPQSGTQLLLSETIRDADKVTSSTFLGAQQPIGPFDVGAGYTYRSQGSNLMSVGLGIHFTRDTTLRLGAFADGFDPDKVREFGANTAFEARF